MLIVVVVAKIHVSNKIINENEKKNIPTAQDTLFDVSWVFCSFHLPTSPVISLFCFVDGGLVTGTGLVPLSSLVSIVRVIK